MNFNEISFRVRYSETDQMGVVHHGNYALYLEMGRTEWLREFGISYNEECLEIEDSVDPCTPPTCNNPPQELACCIDMEGNGHEISLTEGAENATIIAGDTNIDIIQATPSTGIIVQFGSNHVECITVIGGGGGSFAAFTVAYTLNDIYHCVEIIADTSDNCQ